MLPRYWNGGPQAKEYTWITAVRFVTEVSGVPLFVGCCICKPYIRLAVSEKQNACPDCGTTMIMHRIPTYQEDMRLLVALFSEAGAAMVESQPGGIQ